MKRRVVITGMGAVSPIGCGVDRMWENAGNGVCGIDYIKSFDTEGMAVKIAAENLHSKCGWTPYEGMDGLFPETTVVGGTAVWHKGEFVRGRPLWLAGAGRKA